MKEPLVYIVSLNWNGLNDTLECLNSLESLSYSNFRHVVVDNGSKNDEAAKIKKEYPEVHVIENEKNEGFVIGNNQGISHALENKADYILMLNNDTVVTPNFLKILVEHMVQNEDVGVCGPAIKYEDSDEVWFGGGRIIESLGLNWHEWKGKSFKDFRKEVQDPKPVDFITGCALFIRASIIDDIGVLDPMYFLYCEDMDFCHRVRSSGHLVEIVPESVISHKKSASFGKKTQKKFTWFQTYLISRSTILFVRKNVKGIRKYIGVVAVCATKSLQFLINGIDWKARTKSLSGLWDGIRWDIDSGDEFKMEIQRQD